MVIWCHLRRPPTQQQPCCPGLAAHGNASGNGRRSQQTVWPCQRSVRQSRGGPWSSSVILIYFLIQLILSVFPSTFTSAMIIGNSTGIVEIGRKPAQNLSDTFNLTSYVKTRSTSNDIPVSHWDKDVTDDARKSTSIPQHSQPPSLPKKTVVILFILLCCCIIAVSINFINLQTDYMDLRDFYRGYMGRRLLIIEGRLTSKSYQDELKNSERIRLENGPQVSLSRLHATPPNINHFSQLNGSCKSKLNRTDFSYLANGHVSTIRQGTGSFSLGPKIID